MSSIYNTQQCLLKAPGVTYERLLPICLTLFSCSSCHAVCMSAAAADRSLSCLPLQPHPHRRHRHSSPLHPTVISGSLRNGLAMWGYSGTTKAATPRPPAPTSLTWMSYFLPLQQKTKTNLIMRLHGSGGGGTESPYINVVLWQSSIHMTCDFSDRVCLTLTTERWRRTGCPSLASPALISSLLHRSPHSSLCAQLNKQARGRFPLWKPWKMARTFPPISGISIWRRHSRSHCPPRPISVCVLVILHCRDGFHSPLATMRLAHQVDSIRIDNPFQ